MMIRWALILACSSLLLAACASVPVPRPRVERPARMLVPTPEARVAYHVFAGELALRRQKPAVAAAQYVQAAAAGTDPALAAHAATVAYQAGDDQLAFAASQRWLALAPEDTAALRVAAVLDVRLGHTNAAVQQLRKLLVKAAPSELVLIGHMLEQEASAGQGLPVMRQLVAAYPESAEAHYALAHIALQARHPDLAASEAARAQRLKPGWSPAIVLEADALLAQGQKDAAVNLLRAHQKSAPKDIDLHLAYAAMLAEAGDEAQARSEFEAVLQAAPHDPDALYSLGVLALQDKQFPLAGKYFQRLLATGQRNDDAFYFLGDTAEASGEHDAALKWYQQVDGGRYWLPAQVGTARMLIAEGKADEARTYMDSLVAADPDDGARLRSEEAQLFSAVGDSQAALAIFSQALSEYPGNADLLYARALLQESLGHVGSAESDLHAVLSRKPDDAAALNALGYILTLHTTRYEEARSYIERALQLKPGDPAVLDSLGWVEFRLGERKRAVDALRRAYAQSPDPEIAAHLTEALWEAGDQRAAREVWSDALARHPGNALLLKFNSRFPR